MTLIKPASDFSEQPKLFALGGSAKKFLQWRTWTKGATVFFEHGEVDGKKTTHNYTAEAVNEGKANYRDPVAQAKFESNAAWKIKIKEGYFTDLEEAKKAKVIRPMKAHRMDKQGHKLRYPCHAQRKYNGYRCLSICDDTGYIYLMSTGGETYNVPHIVAELKTFMRPGDMLDGELYLHGMSLQLIGSLVKKNRPESAVLQFHMYDMPQSENVIQPWSVRLQNLQLAINRYHNAQVIPFSEATGHLPKLFAAETVKLHDENELARFNKTVIEQGYEGVILRNFEGDYRFKAGCYRSYDVFKHKDFKDGEFTVLDITSRVHSINGEEITIADVCVCRNNLDEQTFKVVPRGEIAVKKDYWDNRENYIGKRMTVRYLERSDDGIPQGNPVGMGFRLDEDLPEEEGEGMFE